MALALVEPIHSLQVLLQPNIIWNDHEFINKQRIVSLLDGAFWTSPKVKTPELWTISYHSEESITYYASKKWCRLTPRTITCCQFPSTHRCVYAQPAKLRSSQIYAWRAWAATLVQWKLSWKAMFESTSMASPSLSSPLNFPNMVLKNPRT